MNLAFPRFDRIAVSEVLAHDFAVLLAGLSAHQSASATARHQILLESSRPAEAVDAAPEVGIFVESAGSGTIASAGSFSASVARVLNGDLER